MAQRIFIRYPVVSGGWDYVQIDPARASLNMLTELWTKARQQGGDIKYVHAFGYENLISKQHNTDELDELIEQVLHPMQVAIDGNSPETSATLSSLTTDIRKLKDVFASIGSGQIKDAEHKLRDLLWSIQSTVCTIASLLEFIQEEVSGLNSVNQSWQNASQLSDDARGWYDDWSEQAMKIIEYVGALKGFRSTIESETQRATIGKRHFDQSVAEAQVIYSESLLFLDDPESLGHDNFCERAQAFSVDCSKEDRTAMEQDIASAREHIARCRDLAKALHEDWVNGRTVLVQKSVQLNRDITRCVNALLHSRNSFTGLRDGIFADKPAPFSLNDPAISEEDFCLAMQYVDSSEWIPSRAKSRLVALAQALPEHYGSEPECSAELERAMSFAMQHIERIESDWRHEDQKSGADENQSFGFVMPTFGKSSSSDDEEDDDSVSAESRPSATDRAIIKPSAAQTLARRNGNGSGQDAASQKGGIEATIDLEILYSRATFDQVHDLLLCCGYVITCNASGISLSNANALLKTVRKLNLVHPRILNVYWDRMQDYIEEPDRCTIVQERSNLTRMWRSASTPWVKTLQPINKWCWMKVSPYAREMCQFLMAKYGITAEQIRAAKKDKDSDEGWDRR